MKKIFGSSLIILGLGLLSAPAVHAGVLVDTVSVETMQSRFSAPIAKSRAFIRINNFDAAARNVVVSLDTNGNGNGEVITQTLRLNGHSFLNYEIPEMTGFDNATDPLSNDSSSRCNLDFARFVIDASNGSTNSYTYGASGNFPCPTQYINIALTWVDQFSYSDTSSIGGAVREFTPINASIYKIYETTANGTGDSRRMWVTELKTMDRLK